jgi:hypothetical protein
VLCSRVLCPAWCAVVWCWLHAWWWGGVVPLNLNSSPQTANVGLTTAPGEASASREVGTGGAPAAGWLWCWLWCACAPRRGSCWQHSSSIPPNPPAAGSSSSSLVGSKLQPATASCDQHKELLLAASSAGQLMAHEQCSP